MSRAAVFLDRDGVINQNRSDYVKAWDELVFLPGVFEALARLADSPFAVVVITNQSPIGRGIITRATVEDIHRRLVNEVCQQGGRIDAIYYCPHRPEEGCACRKPQPGMLVQAAHDLDLDLKRSFMIGDAVSDVRVARNAGCTPVLVLSGLADQLAQLPQGERAACLIEPNLPAAVAHILRQMPAVV